MSESKFDKKMKHWKSKYGCSLGDAGGYCDGKNATRCPKRLNCKGGEKACELAL